MNTKFGIGVVVAIVMQVSAFVWWTAQQAQTIETLKAEVDGLTSQMAVERQINKERDVKDLRQDLNFLTKALNKHIENNDTRIKHNNSLVQEDFEKIYNWLYEIDNDIEMLIEFARFTENKWADSYGTDDTYERKWGTKPPSEE
jgi:hypothetical protein